MNLKHNMVQSVKLDNMTRTKELYVKFNSNRENWVTKIFVGNLPTTLLANDYIMQTSIIMNSALLIELENSVENAKHYDFTKNL